MEYLPLILLFGIGSLFGCGFLAWTYTEPGEKWLKEL